LTRLTTEKSVNRKAGRLDVRWTFWIRRDEMERRFWNGLVEALVMGIGMMTLVM
jgi:hypothetical protein